MAGEYDIARRSLAAALEAAAADRAMSEDGMAEALLVMLITHLLKRRPRKDLESFIAFQLDSCGEDEFVVTRGC